MQKQKTLYLLRHAKASSAGPDMADIDRGLHDKGISEAYQVASQMNSLNEIPQLIISSPAARAMATALIFQRVLNVDDQKIIVDNRLFDIDTGELNELILELDDHHYSIMLVGHNPAFSYFAAQFDAGPVHMSTGSVVRFDFNAEKWKDLNLDIAERKLFLEP